MCGRGCSERFVGVRVDEANIGQQTFDASLESLFEQTDMG